MTYDKKNIKKCYKCIHFTPNQVVIPNGVILDAKYGICTCNVYGVGYYPKVINSCESYVFNEELLN